MTAQTSKPSKSVLFIAPSAYPLGGVQTWLDYLLPGIEAHGFSSTIALTSGQYHDVATYLEQHPFSKFEVLRSQSGTARGRVEAIEQLLIDTHPDIVVAVNIADVYQAVNNLRKAEQIKTRLVNTTHGIDPHWFSWIQQNHRIIDAVVSTNKLTKKLVEEQEGIEQQRSLYAPYGVKRPKVTRSKNNQYFTIGYAGRMDQSQKRFADTLDIFDKILTQNKSVRILVAGDGSARKSLENWLEKKQDLASQVDDLGTLHPDKMSPDFYSKIDAFLLTSEWETGPIVAWESMAHKVCFISSRYKGYAEEGSLVNEHNCLLFDIGDTNKACEQIELCFNKELQGRLITSGLELIQNKYSQEKSIHAWVECFNQVLTRQAKKYSSTSQKEFDRGRLTTYFTFLFGKRGNKIAEKLRRLFRIEFAHVNPGSEWPHSYPDDRRHQINLAESSK